jgi:5-methylcytosine-specific restriction protein A
MTAHLSNPAASPNPRRQWYGTQLWKTRRAHQLQVEPLCCLCKEKGKIEPATVADHFPPCGADYNAFVMGPLRSLCAACHDALSGFVHKGYSSEIGLDGFPVDSNHPFNRVRR